MTGVKRKRRGASLFHGLLLLAGAVRSGNSQRIAIIGGAISGSFSAKYLADYDNQCNIQTITVFDPMPADRPVSEDIVPDDDWQGSRVASLKRTDGSTVELGASVAYKAFHLVTEMIRADPSLEAGTPFNTGKPEENLRDGMGIFDGFGKWPLLTSMYSKFFRKYQILFRYNVDLVKVAHVCQDVMEAFATIPERMKSLNADTFYESPYALWEATDLDPYVNLSFDTLLDAAGVPKELPWWRKLLPYQGSLRDELLSAINLVNYNQDNSQVTGLTGLGSFAPSSGGLFSIVGGNYKLIESAFGQANSARQNACKDKNNNHRTIDRVEKRITTVLGKIDGFVLYDADQEIVGEFDIVILAAPLQQARIKFLIQSHMDEAVIQPMPLAGMVNPHNDDNDNDNKDKHTSTDEEGHSVLPAKLPDSAVRPYKQVVTTVVSNGTLNAEYLSMDESYLPRSVLATKKGKAALHNMTAITQVSTGSSGGGVYKMFSNDKLDDAVLKKLFGDSVKTEYVKLWGGPHGGATPDYQGEGVATSFLLYDVAGNLDGDADDAGALYYPSALEQSSLACMEMSAIGARAVAKLVAQRLDLIESVEVQPDRDEL